ncbi:PadR family transcriptional regulator [Micromonospora sp. NPDC007271]|uniref:PadR family transcriptional regulator n=1 Tax=Micromonospora sp. NPDC007271 TaxID=3154587 RepID=UPI0033D8CF8E
MRMTIPVAKVLAALLADPEAPRYGLDLMKLTGLPSGTLYPVLHRLQTAGWLAAEWEEVDPVAAGRPARRYYRLTPEGVRAARPALAELRALAPDGRAPRGGIAPTGAPAW